MKKCPKSQPEPACLSDFRINNNGADWDDFRHLDGYITVRSITRRDQGSLCAFCEMYLDENNEQIAHFHPKSDKSESCNWAFEWSNLWLACKGGSQTWLQSRQHYLPPLPDNLSCDEYKGAQVVDGAVFAPHEVPAFPRIFRYEQHADSIEIHVDEEACCHADIDTNKASETIRQFNLNCNRLMSARLAVYRPIEKAIAKLREQEINPEVGLASLVKKHLSKDTNGNWPQFFTLIRWRFGTASEQYLQSLEYDG